MDSSITNYVHTNNTVTINNSDMNFYCSEIDKKHCTHVGQGFGFIQ